MKNIGIDLGNTVVGSRKLNDKFWIDPDCFRVLSKIVNSFDNVYIISKVNSEQQERSLKWIKEIDFFNKTGINPNNLYYCFERKDKSLFARALGINYFIDDQPEVMYYMDDSIFKLLINPLERNLEQYKNKLIYTILINSWKEIEDLLFYKKKKNIIIHDYWCELHTHGIAGNVLDCSCSKRKIYEAQKNHFNQTRRIRR